MKCMILMMMFFQSGLNDKYIMTRRLIEKILTEELFGKTICESEEDHQIVKFFYDHLLLEKLLWGEPVSVPELRKLLRNKILNFEFVKLNGDVRPAKGTTMMKYIPQKDHPKGIRPSSPKVATFFDLDKQEWRSVSNRSKEIVLKKDKEKNRPVFVIADKGKAAEIEKREKEKTAEEKYAEKLQNARDKERIKEEPTDELEVGDVRNFLNKNGKNIIIKINRIMGDGTVYAETIKEKTPFRIPPEGLRNIGEIVPPEEYIEAEPEPSNPKELKPVTPATPDGKDEPDNRK